MLINPHLKGSYSQGFAVNTIAVGINKAVGKTKGLLVLVKGNQGTGKRPIGKREPRKFPWENPKFDWDRSLIFTKHIKIKSTKKELTVDCVFIEENEIDERKVEVWAKELGYESVKILVEGEVELL